MTKIVPIRRNSGKSAPSRFVPDDFELSDDLIAWTRRTCPQMHIESEFDTFRDYEFRRNYTDWVRVWRNWVRNYIKFNSNSRNPELYVGMQSRPPVKIRDYSDEEIDELLGCNKFKE